MNGYDPLQVFQRSVSAWPQRAALEVGGRSYSYQELDRWSTAVAHALWEQGASGERIAFVATKDASSYATVLGILKAGGSFVPLPADGPDLRWQQMLAKAAVRFVLGSKVVIPDIIAIQCPSLPDDDQPGVVPERSSEEVYVLFTSGSTGGPKGVSVSRGNVSAYLGHLLTCYDFTEEDRFTQFFALTFDLSVHDLFVCWGAGGCLCVPGDDVALTAARFVRDAKLSVWFSVPSLAAMMHRMRSLSPNVLPSLRYVFFCGEALDVALAEAFALAAPQARLINLYGPTEATIAITAFEYQRGIPARTAVVPIGKPFPGHSARLVDGELQLAGPQITGGYVNDPPSTDRAFKVLPGSSERWYRTGDGVRMDDAGDLHFIGRVDDQVKVLGHRVEPAEVDHVLRAALNGGSSATVPVSEGLATRLITFVDVPVDVRSLMELCRTSLPAHMVPERIIVIPAIPLTAHGKVDRKQLKERAADA